MNGILTLPPPPSRCACGHTRLNHPGGLKCRLCKCCGFDLFVEKLRALPDHDALALDEAFLCRDGTPRAAGAIERIKRDAEIKRLAGSGLSQARIAETLNMHQRTVERALKRIAA